MSVTVRITGDANDLLSGQEKVKAGADKVNAEYREWLKQVKELDAAHRRFNTENASAFDKHANKIKDIEKLWASGRISAEQYHAAIKRAQTDFNSAADKGQSHFVSMIRNAGLAAAAIGLVQQAWQHVLDVQRESIELDRSRAEKTRVVQQGITGFVSMQPEGTQRARLQQVNQLARGVMDIPEAANAFQGLQSAIGSFDATVPAFQEVIRAARVDLPGDLGSELAIQGLNAGIKPDQMIRAAFAAGQASARSPREVARAAPAIPGFGDAQFGASVAAQLATIDANEVKSLTFAAQKALSGSSGAARWFKRQGLGPDATSAQRLQALQTAGIDTPDELRQIGITEELQVRAMTGITGANFGVLQNVRKAVAEAVNDPNYLESIRKRNEDAFPTMDLVRQLEEQDSVRAEWQGFNAPGVARKVAETRAFNEMRARGIETDIFGRAIFNEEGEMQSPWMFYFTASQEQQRIMMRAHIEAQAMVGVEVDRQMAESKRRKPTVQKQEH